MIHVTSPDYNYTQLVHYRIHKHHILCVCVCVYVILNIAPVSRLPFLGAFVKLQKSTISFVMSYLSVRPPA